MDDERLMAVPCMQDQAGPLRRTNYLLCMAAFVAAADDKGGSLAGLQNADQFPNHATWDRLHAGWNDHAILPIHPPSPRQASSQPASHAVATDPTMPATPPYLVPS